MVEPEGVMVEPPSVTDAGEAAGTADEGSARKGHCLCLHLLFDFWFVQLEHSLQGVARQAGHLLQALRGGFLFCFPPASWRGFIVAFWN